MSWTPFHTSDFSLNLAESHGNISNMLDTQVILINMGILALSPPHLKEIKGMNPEIKKSFKTQKTFFFSIL